MRFLFILMVFGLTACVSHVSDQVSVANTFPGLGSAPGMPMSVEECGEAAGHVIGDIGDGRVHRADFVCDNGEAPLGIINYQDGEPIATEGAVCCGQGLSN